MDTRQRWLAVGRGMDADPRAAGRRAALAARGGMDPALLVVFSCGQVEPAPVLAGVAEVFAGVPLIGCSAESVVATEGLDGPGVVVTALGGRGFSASTAVASALDDGPRAAGAAVAGCV